MLSNTQVNMYSSSLNWLAEILLRFFLENQVFNNTNYSIPHKNGVGENNVTRYLCVKIVSSNLYTTNSVTWQNTMLKLQYIWIRICYCKLKLCGSILYKLIYYNMWEYTCCVIYATNEPWIHY